MQSLPDMISASLLVRDLMTAPVVVVQKHAPLAEAKAQMDAAHVRHLPVVDHDERVIGVISQSDLAVALALERYVDEDDPSGWHVGQIVEPRVYGVGADAPAHEAAALMVRHRIGSLPVLDGDGRAVGIVTASDFVEVARRMLVGLPPILANYSHSEPR